jgi:hypothetical protein
MTEGSLLSVERNTYSQPPISKSYFTFSLSCHMCAVFTHQKHKDPRNLQIPSADLITLQSLWSSFIKVRSYFLRPSWNMRLYFPDKNSQSTKYLKICLFVCVFWPCSRYYSLILCSRWQWCNTQYSAFGKSLCTYKMYLKWCPRTSIQALTRLILFPNTFCRSAFGKSLCIYKMCWKWCPRA